MGVVAGVATFFAAFDCDDTFIFDFDDMDDDDNFDDNDEDDKEELAADDDDDDVGFGGDLDFACLGCRPDSRLCCLFVP